MPKQQNLSLNKSASIQYGAYVCYSRTVLNPWLTVDGIQADHQHVFVSRFDILWLFMLTGKTKTTSNSAMAETARARRFQESAGKWQDWQSIS